MDWTLAIDRNRAALLRIVAALFAMAGLADDTEAPALLLPRRLHNAVLRLLRPAESAARRLIVIAARAIARPPHSSLAGEMSRKRRGRHSAPAPKHGPLSPQAAASPPNGKRRENFPVLDPLKRFRFGPARRKPEVFPRITCIGLGEPTPVPESWIPSPDDELNATRLLGRLHALKRALDDIDAHAKRLARWNARRDAGRLRHPRRSPLRPGRPPGCRRRPLHPVDGVLAECDALARHALEAPDSS